MGEARRKSKLPKVTNAQVAQHADPTCSACNGKGVTIEPTRDPIMLLCDCAMREFETRAGSRVIPWGGGLRWTS